ncbi:MAG: hypothetical protein LC800_09065 [Acidobacteria bacterium]|nr:hypothetical protein [Acidobacteriota bacterium]
MQNAAALDAPRTAVRRRAGLRRLARACRPTLAQTLLAALSALLLVLSFPDFDLWPLAWVGLVPLMLAVTRGPARGAQAFALGWLAGTLYFYGSCWWLTHSMIHYGGIPRPVAYLLLAPVTIIVGLFPAAWALLLRRAAARWGAKSLLLAPSAWAALEWARLAVTGQLWNALGYSQTYQPTLIQPAAWGGVYAVSFLILTTNSAVAFALLRKSPRSLAAPALAAAFVALTVWASARAGDGYDQKAGGTTTTAVLVALQPNVSPNFARPVEENDALVARHLSMSADALREWDATLARPADHGHPTPQGEAARQERRAAARVVVWPESPMNFEYANDARFRETVARFAREQRASVYLGRTPVLRQHLANAVFRAVENRRPVLRVTNTGITARISPRGEVSDATESFRPDVRTWTVARATGGKSFYTRHGDLFVALCAVVSLIGFAASMKKARTA